MPRFRFNIHDAHFEAPDEEGQELPGLAQARAVAIAGIRSILGGELESGVIDLRGHIDVADESGRVMMRVDFAEAVEIRDANS
jgi:hypothetical protein